MKKLIFIVALMSLLMIFGGCAEANKPADPGNGDDSNKRFVVKKIYPLQCNPVDMDVTDSRVYVAQKEGGVTVIDHKDLKELITFNQIQDGFISINLYAVKQVRAAEESERLFIYNTEGSDEIGCYDISDIYNPVKMSAIIGNTQGIRDLQVFRNNGALLPEDPFLAEAAEESDITVMRTVNRSFSYAYYHSHVTDSTDGVPFSYSEGFPDFPVNLNRFDVDDEYFVFAGGSMGVYFCKISDLNSPEETPYYNINTYGEAMDVYIGADKIVYVADRHKGLAAVDYSDINNLTLIEDAGFETSSGLCRTIAGEGNILALSSSIGGVYIFDISDPKNPVFIEKFACDYANSVAVKNGNIFIASREEGIIQLEDTK